MKSISRYTIMRRASLPRAPTLSEIKHRNYIEKRELMPKQNTNFTLNIF